MTFVRKSVSALMVLAWSALLVVSLARAVWSVPWLGCLAILSTAVLFTLIAYRVRETLPVETLDEVLPVDPDAAHWAFNHKYDEIFPHSAMPRETLIKRLGNPKKGVVRSSIKLKFLGTQLKVWHSRTLDIDEPGEILPVLKMRKGTITDERTVAVDGEKVATLSRLECHGCALETLERFANQLRPPVDPNESWYKAVQEDVERVVARETAALSEEVVVVKKVVGDAFVEGYAPDEQEELKRAVLPLLQMIEDMAEYQTVVVLVSRADKPSMRRIVVTEYHTPNREVLSRRCDEIRFFFGLEPRDFKLFLPEAFESPSLHVRCEAPRGMYTFDAIPSTNVRDVLEDFQGERRKKVCPKGDPPEPWRDDSLGFDYVHAYFHELHELPAGLDSVLPGYSDRLRAQLVVKFRERPPGSMPVLVVASVFLTTLVLLTGGNFDTFFGADPRLTLALVYGLPGLFAGWIVSRVEPEVLGRISIPTFLNAVWFVVNSVLAICIVARFAATDPDPKWVWLVLTLSCVSQTLFAFLRYGVKHRRHVERLRVSCAALRPEWTRDGQDAGMTQEEVGTVPGSGG